MADPVADSKEWWEMQAKRYQAETEQVTNDARAAAAKASDDVAAANSRTAEALRVAEKAASSYAAEFADLTAKANAATTALAAHQQCVGDLLQTMGPALARISQLISA